MDSQKLSLLPLKQWNAPLPLGHKEAGRWVKVVSVDELEAALACAPQAKCGGGLEECTGCDACAPTHDVAELASEIEHYLEDKPVGVKWPNAARLLRESMAALRAPAVRRPSRGEIADALGRAEQIADCDFDHRAETRSPRILAMADAVLALFDGESEAESAKQNPVHTRADCDFDDGCNWCDDAAQQYNP